MSRQSVVTEPALPATCLICRRSANGAIRFIDFNFDFDFYGAVVVCEDCITESHELLGFVKIEKLQVAEHEISLLVEKNEQLNADVDSYRSIIDSLNLVRPDLELHSDEPQEPIEPISESSDTTKSSEPESVKSNSGRGSKDVPDSGDGDANLFG